LLLPAVLVVGIQATTAAPAAAAPGQAMQECRTNSVNSSSSWTGEISGTAKLVTTISSLQPGTVVRITASGSVHNGSWFGQ
jgi:hypothetical protein